MTLRDLQRGYLILGAAGAGKTTKLVTMLTQLVEDFKMQPHQTIPVLSAMHGARRRLTLKLQALQKSREWVAQGVHCTVTTLDSLTLSLANRYRRSMGVASKPLGPDSGPRPFEAIHTLARDVLCSPALAATIAATFPLVVIDELQDVRESALEFIQQLSTLVPILAAADPFQDINAGDHSAPAVTWAADVLQIIEMGDGSRRTKNPAILNAATALRNNRESDRPTPPVYSVQSGPVAASTIMTFVRCKGWGGPLALLSFKMSDRFVQDTLAALDRQRRPGEKMQRLPFLVQRSEQSERDEIAQVLQPLDDSLPLTFGGPFDASLDLTEAWQRCSRDARLMGQSVVRKDELLRRAFQIAHVRRSFAFSSRRRVALAIHSAKNQEWSNVIVLWNKRQFQKSMSDEYRRRLLYNAITRAAQRCLILVYDPGGSELKEDPVLRLLVPAPTSGSGPQATGDLERGVSVISRLVGLGA